MNKSLRDNKNITPKIGEIWTVGIPSVFYNEKKELEARFQMRPYLVLDDGRGLIVEENPDYHCFKITGEHTQRVIKIEDFNSKGLKKESYLRIEMPIKVEHPQFQFKIGSLSSKELYSVYRELYQLLNVETLRKLSEEGQEENQD